MPLEAVQEFQISTQRFSAENGRSQGAAINMITKSGTNNYHGSIFGYFRNSALNTDEKVANGDGTSTPQHPDYSRQFFGGSIGGPFVKDKLFGFFAIERQRESQGLSETGSSYTELVLAQKAGLAAQPALTIPRPFHEWRYTGRMDPVTRVRRWPGVGCHRVLRVRRAHDQCIGHGHPTRPGTPRGLHDIRSRQIGRALGWSIPYGANRKLPACRSRRLAKMLGESNAGTQSQSTVPSGAISAPVWQWDRNA